MTDLIKVRCPDCGVKLKVKPKHIGTTQKCPGCGEHVLLEAAQESPLEDIESPRSDFSPEETSHENRKPMPVVALVAAGVLLIGVGVGLGSLFFGGGDSGDEEAPGGEVADGRGTQPGSGEGTTPGTGGNETTPGIFPTDGTASTTVASTVNGSGARATSTDNLRPTIPEADNEVVEAGPTPARPRTPTVVTEPGTANSIGIVLQLVKAGSYERRSGISRPNYFAAFKSHASYGGFGDEGPPHDVVITKPFLIGRTEVTVGQFKQFVEATGHKTTAETTGEGIVGLHGETTPERNWFNPLGQRPEFTWKSPGFEQTDNHPVTGVSWDDAQAFCRWLGEKEGVTYRLPTEAEWEYVCRAGTEAWFSFGNDYASQFHHYANLADGTLEDAHEQTASWQWILPEARDGAVYTQAVGSYQPNAWGVHDMHGNVWEWCQDVYSDTFYKPFRHTQERAYFAAVDVLNTDETTYPDGDFRIIRGGAWNVSPIQARCGVRGYFERKDAACYVGFRVVREASPEELEKARQYRERQLQAIAAISENTDLIQTGYGHALHDEKDEIFLNVNRPTPEMISHLPYLTRVRYLNVGAGGEATPELIEAISKMTGLRRLVINNTGPDCPADAYEPLSQLENLAELRITHEAQLSPAALRKFKSLPNLVRLEFGNPSTDDEQLLALRGVEFPKLTSLNIRHTNSDGSGLAAFQGAPLKTAYLRSLSDAGASQLGQFSELTSVTIQEPQITRAGLAELTKLSKLERLDLQNLKQLGDTDFAGLEAMSGLRELRLTGSGAGDQTAQRISNLLLANLYIGSPAFTDEGLTHVGNITTLCGRLEVGTEAQITDAGIQKLWGPAKLRALNLYPRSGITGSSFEIVADMTRLSSVEVHSEDFTDTGMRYLGYLPELQRVTLGHNNHGPKGVTDEGLLMIAEAPKLKVLTLHRTGCPVTDAGLEALKQKRPDLQVNTGP